LVTVIIAGGMVGVYAYSRSLKRKNVISTQHIGRSAARLRGISGITAGREIKLKDGDTLGRGPKNVINLNDPSVSREHAIFRYKDSTWFIQDRNSSGGILINGERVIAMRLNHGDQVKVGNQVFVFESD
jgi:pSer/pThr/pTyr-binding forkhead associated (FHA) protein